MKFEVPPLPYPKDALEPAMSRNTLEFHYEKHHKGYMTKLKAAIEGTPDESKSLEEIVRSSRGAVFNNAAQVCNHTFFWNSMKPNGGGAPPDGPLADMFHEDFGGWEGFRKQFIQTGMDRFGSGYVWLVLKGSHLKVLSTGNAETPLITSAKPLLTCDLWEHAYYLDYQNKRDTFLEQFCDKLINWEFALKNLDESRVQQLA
jgi:superoxide dismutase, Fe-Mn family